MIGKIDDATIATLARTLGESSLRATVVAANLANVDTPGYKAQAVEFQEQFGPIGGLEPTRTAPGHRTDAGAGGLRPLYTEAGGTRMRADGNTVDVDLEMTRLASLQGRFRAAAQLVRKRFGLLRYAITDGRG